TALPPLSLHDALPISKRWVDAWDINAMYLGAARSLPLGIGAPVELTGDVQFDKNLPGYWRIANPPAWEHARLPDPLQVDGRKSRDRKSTRLNSSHEKS